LERRGERQLLIEAADNNTALAPALLEPNPNHLHRDSEAKQAEILERIKQNGAAIKDLPIPRTRWKKMSTSHPPIAAVLKIIDNRLGLSKFYGNASIFPISHATLYRFVVLGLMSGFVHGDNTPPVAASPKVMPSRRVSHQHR